MRIALLAALLAACSFPQIVDCRSGDGPAVARDVYADLARAGWTDIVVESHPVVAGRYLVRARRGARGLAGKIESGVAGCDGARVDLRDFDLPADSGRRVAGPSGPRSLRH